MYDADKIVRERQRLIRREIERRGIPIKAIQLDGGWDHPSTVVSYFPADKDKEPAIMSLAALHRLFAALPLDMLSLLLPDGYAVVRVPEGVDHDETASQFHDYLAAKQAAHRPDSEAGRELGPNEDARLRAKLTVIQGGSIAA